MPIRSEISPLGLVEELVRRGQHTAMPVTPEPGNPLEFRLWKPGDPLADGPYGTKQPGKNAKRVEPELWPLMRNATGLAMAAASMTARLIRPVARGAG